MDVRRHLSFGEWQTGQDVPEGPAFRLGQRWRERRFGEEVELETVGDLWRSCYADHPGELLHGGVRWIFGARYVKHSSRKVLSALELRTGWDLVGDVAAEAEAMLAPLELVGVLGESRIAAPVWPDGSYICPFCRAAVVPEFSPEPKPGLRCPNRACEAGGASAAQAQTARTEQARLKAEHEQWQKKFAARKPGETEQQIRKHSEQQHAEAQALSGQGFCATCFLEKGKRVRHRRPGYHLRRRSA